MQGLWLEWAMGSEGNEDIEDVSKTSPWLARDAIYPDKLMCFCGFVVLFFVFQFPWLYSFLEVPVPGAINS